MSFSSSVLRQGARWSLCVAALLSFFGASIGPATHLHGGDQVLIATVELVESDSAPSGSTPNSPAPHDELGCFVCQVLTTLGAPASGSPIEVRAAVGFVPAHDEPQVVSSPHAATPQARAPPAA